MMRMCYRLPRPPASSFLFCIFFAALSTIIAAAADRTNTSIRHLDPPPVSLIQQHSACVRHEPFANSSSFSCRGAQFVSTLGFLHACSQHSDCYDAREPSDWCLLSPVHMWTNWGCHCDIKLGTCLIERYDSREHRLEWAYCSPKNEFYCATKFDDFIAYFEQIRNLPPRYFRVD